MSMAGRQQPNEATPLRGADLEPGRTADSVSAFDGLGEEWGLRQYHVRCVVASVIFTLVPASIAGPIPFTFDDLKWEYGIDDAEAAFVSGGTFLGSIAGSFLFGMVSDRIGRRACLAICFLMVAVISATHLALPLGSTESFKMLLVIRVLLGLPHGGLIAVVILYMIEFFSDEYRTVAATCLTFSWRLGSMISIQIVKFSYGNWRLAYASPTLLAVFSMALLALMPESPQWLVANDRGDEAKRVFQSISASSQVFAPSAAFAAAAARPPPPPLAAGKKLGAWEGMAKLVSPSVLPSTAVACLLSILSYAGGTAIWTWAPLIAESMAGRGAVGLWAFTGMEVAGCLGVLITMLSIDRYGRRAVIGGSFLLGGVVCLTFAMEPSVPGIIVCLQLLGLQNALMFSATTAYIAEIFPIAIRGVANGLVLVCGRLSCMCVPVLVGLLLDRSAPLALLFVAATFFLGLAVSAFIGYEAMPQQSLKPV